MAFFAPVFRALRRARRPIISIALVYALSVAAGIAMVDSGNRYAIESRDNIVNGAQNGSILVAYARGDLLTAAVLDFGSNLFLGAVPQTLGGLGIIVPYPMAAYQGWVGGIVSIDGHHNSRLADPTGAIYYLTVLILQLIPYSLAGGAGVHLGLEYLSFRVP